MFTVILLLCYIQSFHFIAGWQNNTTNLLCNSSLWSTSNGGIWTHSGCAYTSSNEYKSTILWLGDNYSQSLEWKNYRITTMVKFIEGSNTGIMFRKNVYTQYYFSVSASFVWLWKGWQVLYFETMEENYFLNKTRNIIIDISGNRFSFFIDNTFIFEYIDNCSPIYYKGSVGLSSYLSIATFSFLYIDFHAPYIVPQHYSKLSKYEQNTLMELYNSTNGNYWVNTWNVTTIMTNQACKTLCGITCINNVNQLQRNKTVIASIALDWNNLTGTIPLSLKYLTSLKAIHLSHNSLYGEIPNIFDYLTTIHSVILSYNQLNSSLP
eukprot:281034_1